MNTPINTLSIPAILFRERVLDDAGKPLADIPANWELADSKKPELLELGRGQLLIVSLNDSDFLYDAMVPTWNDDDQIIRAVFSPDAGCPEFRMTDIVVAVVENVGSVAYEVLATHGEFPDQLVETGEMCLLLRGDLSLI